MKDLVEADDYTTPITVPEGTDSRDHAAEHVEAIAQRLANRTKNLTLHAARIDAVNVFTQGQQFNIANAGAAMFDSIAGPGAGNAWKLQHQWALGDGKRARLYSGTGDAGLGNWCITTNAYWDPGVAQVWHKDHDAEESNIIRCFQGELHWYGKGPGAGTWGTGGWDTTRGHLRVGDGVYAKNLLASEDALVSRDAIVTRDVLVGHEVIATGDIFVGTTKLYYYYPPPTRAIQIGLNGLNAFESTFGANITLSAGEVVNVPIHVPHGGKLGQCRVKLGGSGLSYSIAARKKTGINMAAATLPTVANVGSPATGTTAAAVENIMVDFGNLTASKDERYWISILNSGAGSLDVHAVEAIIEDPGPRNH